MSSPRKSAKYGWFAPRSASPSLPKADERHQASRRVARCGSRRSADGGAVPRLALRMARWRAAGRPVADVQPLTNGSGTLSDAAGHRHLRRRHRRHYHIDSDDDEVRPTAKERLEMAQMYNISFVDVWIRRRCRGPGTNTSSPQITAVCHRREGPSMATRIQKIQTNRNHPTSEGWFAPL